jgi:hypothetical protein
MDEISGSVAGSIGRRCVGHGAAVRKKLVGITGTLCSSPGDINVMATLAVII